MKKRVHLIQLDEEQNNSFGVGMSVVMSPLFIYVKMFWNAR